MRYLLHVLFLVLVGLAVLAVLAVRVVRVALGVVGLIAILLVIFGGFKWMTSGGSEEKVDEAKKILYSGIIGLVIILSAYALSSFVLKTLTTATGTTIGG